LHAFHHALNQNERTPSVYTVKAKPHQGCLRARSETLFVMPFCFHLCVTLIRYLIRPGLSYSVPPLPVIPRAPHNATVPPVIYGPSPRYQCVVAVCHPQQNDAGTIDSRRYQADSVAKANLTRPLNSGSFCYPLYRSLVLADCHHCHRVSVLSQHRPPPPDGCERHARQKNHTTSM